MYRLTEFEKELQAMAKEFAEKTLAPVVAECDRESRFPLEVFKVYREMGFSMMGIPEKYGGQGLGIFAKSLIAEEIGKIDCGFHASAGTAGLAFLPVEIGGTESQIEKYVDFIKNHGIATFCLTEPEAGSDAGACRTTAVRDGNEYVINGRKCFATSGAYASVYTVFTTVDRSLGTKGLTCFIVERDRPGISIGKEEDKMGLRLSNTVDVVFDDVRVPVENRVGAEGQGFYLAMRTLDRTRGSGGAGAVGMCQRAIDECVAYGKQRKTFGKPIVENQAIQFMLADMEIQTVAARELVWKNARQLDVGIYDSKLGAIVKTFSSDTVMKVTTDAVQIFGGYGYMKDYPVEKLMRDAKIWQIFEGTNQIQRMVIGRALTKEKK